MRMITIPNQSSVPKAWTEFDEEGRMKPSGYRDRVVDVCEEMFKFTGESSLPPSLPPSIPPFLLPSSFRFECETDKKKKDGSSLFLPSLLPSPPPLSSPPPPPLRDAGRPLFRTRGEEEGGPPPLLGRKEAQARKDRNTHPLIPPSLPPSLPPFL